ncbi:hypothetical protein LguiB_020761 [Lonicera macranthoides]
MSHYQRLCILLAVKELHRLYRVQKMLMDELKLKIDQTKMWRDQHQQISRDDLERSGSCSGDAPRIPRGFDLERPPEEDFSVERINGSNEDCSKIELTLTMGCNSTAIERENKENYSERDNIATANSSSTTLNQENSSQPHWLFQDLKLG